MDTILLMTCVMMWALAVLTTISLLKLLKETDRLDAELEEQRFKLIAVEFAMHKMMKGEDDEVREAR